MTNFINSLENYFQEHGLNVEKYSPTAIRHGLDGYLFIKKIMNM